MAADGDRAPEGADGGTARRTDSELPVQENLSVSASSATALLHELMRLKFDFGAGTAARKVEILERLQGRRVSSAKELLELHELLCFLSAYPQDDRVLEIAERMRQRFADRPDLRRHRKALADTGIAGTALNFPFFWLTADWLVQRWPECLRIDWSQWERKERLDRLLEILMPYSETPALDTFAFTSREWIGRLKGADETDGAFIVRRVRALPVEQPVRELLYEDLELPMVLSPGPTTPARTRERWPGSPIVFRTTPLERSRPDLRRAVAAAKPRVRFVDRREGRRLIELANACMVPRHRDLLVFLNADERDVRMVDFGDGLQFACMGAVPERRLMLEAVYGFLTLNNGIPIGYVLCSAFFNSAEVAYNVFETFRGAEAARNYARVLATVQHLFGANSFAVDPYQMGHGNAEGQASGAWWFYYKLGFRPRDPGVKRLVREELAAIRADPAHRTSRSRLNDLAAEYMFLQLGRPRRGVLGDISLGNIGLHVSRYLADHGGGDRETSLDACADEAARLLGLRSLGALPPGERLAWRRWSPLVMVLPAVRRWSTSERRALRDVVRAKGGQRESDFVRLFDAHKKLRRGVLALAEREP